MNNYELLRAVFIDWHLILDYCLHFLRFLFTKLFLRDFSSVVAFKMERVNSKDLLMGISNGNAA